MALITDTITTTAVTPPSVDPPSSITTSPCPCMASNQILYGPALPTSMPLILLWMSP